MSEQHTMIVHSVEVDGLPAVRSQEEGGGLVDELDERVGFIFYNLIFMGHPLPPDENGEVYWIAEDTEGEPMHLIMDGERYGNFTGITHWIEFPATLRKLDEDPKRPALTVVTALPDQPQQANFRSWPEATSSGPPATIRLDNRSAGEHPRLSTPAWWGEPEDTESHGHAETSGLTYGPSADPDQLPALRHPATEVG